MPKRQKLPTSPTRSCCGVAAQLDSLRNLPYEMAADAQTKLQKLPKNSSRARIRNRCSMSGRPRGYKRKYGVSRIQ